MQQQPLHADGHAAYRGNDRVLAGFILGLLSFWLFGMTLLNVNVVMNEELQLNSAMLSLAVSITSLFSGMTIVVFGGLADRLGRVRITRWGFCFAIAGALLIALVPAGSALSVPMLLAGRILQGLSAACIMPATLALLRDYWDEKGRQRAVSLWSMGTWGGMSFAAVVGGAMSDSVGWRWIFVAAAVASIVGLMLVKDIPESKAEGAAGKRMDLMGMVLFLVFIVSLQLFVSNGSSWGWASGKTLGMLAVSVVFLTAFIWFERGVKGEPFINMSLFKNKTFTGATISNFILNGTSGVLIVTLMLMQRGGNVDASTTGLLTVGYGIVILLFIRVGEKLLRRYGARKPMEWGCMILLVSIALMTPTSVYTGTYMVLMAIAYALFGLGLAFYATPSTDAALSNLPEDQSASGSGIYKMASSLGSGFGIAISTAIYSGIVINGRPFTALDSIFLGRSDNLDMRMGAMAAMLFNFFVIVLAIIIIRNTVNSKEK